VWVWLGYVGAENREWLLAWVHRGQGAILLAAAVLVVLVAWVFWRRGRLRHNRLRLHRARRANRGRSCDD
jgi:membrane protein DedA with SNARE-associated domain